MVVADRSGRWATECADSSAFGDRAPGDNPFLQVEKESIMNTIKSGMRRAGVLVALVGALAAVPVGVASSASAAPATPGIPVATSVGFQATQGNWFYWHCIRWHEYWRPACHPHPYPGPYPGPGPGYPPPPPPWGSY
jgi:hypothetical protein